MVVGGVYFLALEGNINSQILAYSHNPIFVEFSANYKGSGRMYLVSSVACRSSDDFDNSAVSLENAIPAKILEISFPRVGISDTPRKFSLSFMYPFLGIGSTAEASNNWLDFCNGSTTTSFHTSDVTP
ncbi:hypothetical protein AYI69_g4908 [Smittium culicis]|uniref:Uncharacterized protein n=1 Tax=Smittium culicis TaxID=133412 RepID=A0A1R1Y9K7_9FUNG|nr:hypothetical protein AYI69_g4908 [Smittium culicis]